MTQEELAIMIAEEKMIAGRLLDDGRYVAVDPLLFDEARLGRGTHRGAYDNVWYYTTIGEAMVAMLTWTGRGEPSGWYRHPSSGRRRPGGDPNAQFVRD